MSINDLLAPIYEFWFNWDNYETLLDCVYSNNDYGKFGWLLLLTPLILLILLYKVWEPMRGQKLMWSIVVILISIIGYSATSGILFKNDCILDELGAYGGTGINPEYFIFQMSMITLLYSVIISFIYTLIIKRFSTHNSHNPF